MTYRITRWNPPTAYAQPVFVRTKFQMMIPLRRASIKTVAPSHVYLAGDPCWFKLDLQGQADEMLTMDPNSSPRASCLTETKSAMTAAQPPTLTLSLC